jgi:hypothetical protein
MEDPVKFKKDGEHRCKSKRKACDMLPLEEFMAECLKNRDKINDKEKPSMNTLRHYIPLLVILLFPSEEQGNKMKVKGMWDNKPEGWPSYVAFKDPNNAKLDPDTGRKGRPTHKTLMDMFMVLLDRYQIQEREKEANRNQPNVESVVLSISTPSNPSDCLPIEEKDIPEILKHIKLKIREVEKNGHVETDNISLLYRVEETLVRKYASNGHQPGFYKDAHDFECLLDCIIECGSKFNPDIKQKWTNFTIEWKNKDLIYQHVSALEMPEGLPTDMSMLNIQTESPNALQALQAGGRLQIRYQTNEMGKLNENKSASQKVFDYVDQHDQDLKKFKRQESESEMYMNEVLKFNTGSMISGFGGEKNDFSAGVAKGSNAEGVLSRAMLVTGICETDPGDAIDPGLFQNLDLEVADSHDFMSSDNFSVLNSMGIDKYINDLDHVDLDENLGGTLAVASYESVTATETIMEPPDTQECGNLGDPGKFNQYQIQQLNTMPPSDSQELPNENVAVVIENGMNGCHPTVSLMTSGQPDSAIENEGHVLTSVSEVSPQEEDMDTDDL